MPKLTKRIIDAVVPQATEFFLWDEGIRACWRRPCQSDEPGARGRPVHRGDLFFTGSPRLHAPTNARAGWLDRSGPLRSDDCIRHSRRPAGCHRRAAVFVQHVACPERGQPRRQAHGDPGRGTGAGRADPRLDARGRTSLRAGRNPAEPARRTGDDHRCRHRKGVEPGQVAHGRSAGLPRHLAAASGADRVHPARLSAAATG